ncbi:MAG: DUF6134 family protein [Acetobacteraceae bacterium]|nr:DUF6134 family protein [Acetobacteraceae bacterium]
MDALIPPGNALAFRLIRHGSPIGTHTVTFERSDAALQVRIAVDAQVRFGPIPLYRYVHHAVEVWRDGLLQEVSSRTDRNGTALSMRAQRNANGLAAQGTGTPPYVAPEEALPTTYWNRRMLHVPLVGIQDATLLHPEVTRRGQDTIRTGSGAPLRVDLWQLSGDLDLTLLYDMDGHWAGMRLTVADGSAVTYERL